MTQPMPEQLRQHQQFRLFAIVLFAGLFVYLLLRAIFNEPLQDELITYSYYVQSGRPHNSDIGVDGNNHLLNTYLCNLVHLLSGDHFFWMRLPNLLSFGLFFYSVYQLLSRFSNRWLPYTGLLALTCIPYLLEYFAFCRGYGLSFAFLTCSFWQLTRLFEGKPNAFGATILTALLAAFANLSLLPLCLLIFGYALIVSFTRKSSRLLRGISLLVFFAGLAYLLAYAFQLRKEGALYWGGTEGLWETTGSSLSSGILFWDAAIWKYVVLGIVILFIVQILLAIRKEKWKAFLRNDIAFITLLLGLLIGTELGFRLLGLKYPLERGGLHIALLFLVCVVVVLNSWRFGKVAHWLLLYFPIVFVSKWNLHTSISSPGDRMPTTFYTQLQPYLNDSSTILCNPNISLPFYYHELTRDRFHFAVVGEQLPTHSDLWITRKDLVQEGIPANYHLVAQDAVTGLRAYHRKAPKVIAIGTIGNRASTTQTNRENSCSLVDKNNYDLQPGQSLFFELKGRFISPETASNSKLFVSGFDANGQPAYFSSTDLRIMLQGRELDENWHLNLKIDGLKGTEKAFTVYFWSPSGEKLRIRNLSYRVTLIE